MVNYGYPEIVLIHFSPNGIFHSGEGSVFTSSNTPQETQFGEVACLSLNLVEVKPVNTPTLSLVIVLV